VKKCISKESLEELSLRISQLIKVYPSSFQNSEGCKKPIKRLKLIKKELYKSKIF
jgi:hypothetical protein